MIKREAKDDIRLLTKYYKVVSVTGPRQSGKTTLIKSMFRGLPYFTLEDPDVRMFAEQDPRSFLQAMPNGGILDEIQRTPTLFSYLQGIVDADKKKKFIISGSQNFLLAQNISQSLAGRVGVQYLLPFSLQELVEANKLSATYEEQLFKGFYPGLYTKKVPPTTFYANYTATYIERDLRLIANIGDLNLFLKFLKLCAGRAGQLINYSILASDAGVSVNTVKNWLSILEASFILYFLPPYAKKLNNRLIKSSKLFFYDTGLLCYLLGMTNFKQLITYYQKGSIFENFVVTEFVKDKLHHHRNYELSFFQDSNGKEIDLILEQGELTMAIEVKSGTTLTHAYFSNLHAWMKDKDQQTTKPYVIYGGDVPFTSKYGILLSWNNFVKPILKDIRQLQVEKK